MVLNKRERIIDLPKIQEQKKLGCNPNIIDRDLMSKKEEFFFKLYLFFFNLK